MTRERVFKKRYEKPGDRPKPPPTPTNVVNIKPAPAPINVELSDAGLVLALLTRTMERNTDYAHTWHRIVSGSFQDVLSKSQIELMDPRETADAGASLFMERAFGVTIKVGREE